MIPLKFAPNQGGLGRSLQWDYTACKQSHGGKRGMQTMFAWNVFLIKCLWRRLVPMLFAIKGTKFFECTFSCTHFLLFIVCKKRRFFRNSRQTFSAAWQIVFLATPKQCLIPCRRDCKSPFFIDKQLALQQTNDSQIIVF